eukprot:1143951-Pelagomonas_calceolata.AAC.2
MSTMRVRVKLSLQHPPDQGLANSGGSQQNLEVRQVPQNQGCQVASILHRLRGSVAASTKARTPWMTVLSRPTSTCCTSSGATLGAICNQGHEHTACSASNIDRKGKNRTEKERTTWKAKILICPLVA